MIDRLTLEMGNTKRFMTCDGPEEVKMAIMPSHCTKFNLSQVLL